MCWCKMLVLIFLLVMSGNWISGSGLRSMVMVMLVVLVWKCLWRNWLRRLLI